MNAPNPPAGGLPLAEAIANPSPHRLDEAISMAKAALAEGRPIDQELAELLRHELEKHGGGSTPRLRRALEILSALNAGRLVLDIKSLLLTHSDSRIRSKATLMVGKATRNAAWISRRILEPDSRIQANAVESVWGVDTTEVREILSTSLKSPYNRVVANALVGLHRIGDVNSIPKLLEMAQNPSEATRISAVWAIGETGDPRFVPFLMKAYQSEDTKCRGMVLRSLTRLRRQMNLLHQSGVLDVSVWEALALPGGVRNIGIALLLPATLRNPVQLSPLDIAIMEGESLITSYSVEALPDPDLLVMGFAIPRIVSNVDPFRVAMETALEDCMEIKRRRDLWAIERYISGLDPEAEIQNLAQDSEDPALVRHTRANRGFLAEPQFIGKAIPGPGRRDHAAANLFGALEKLTTAVERVAGTRHIFAQLDPEQKFADWELAQLGQLATECDVSMHGIAPDSYPHGGFADVCVASGGTFTRCPAEHLAARMVHLYQGQLNRYRITYGLEKPEDAQSSAEVKIYSPHGCARIEVALRQLAVDPGSG